MYNYGDNLKIDCYQEDQFLDHVSDSELALRLGIKNWNAKSKSYTKTLYNNNSIAYDNEGIYLIDKLEITFSSNEYYSFEESTINIKFGNINLIRETGKKKHFHYQFKIYVEDYPFGYVDFHSTANFSIHKIEVSNETLYLKNKMFVLNTLYEIASHFSFTFSNISRYELARDTEVNYYDQFCKVYYQSDFCAMQIHEIYQSKPRFSFYGKRKMIIHQTDSKRTESGTALIGSKESDSQVKLYDKSHELKKWNEEKSYINEIHHRFFINADVICRVEVIANSKAFYKRELDLIDLMIPEKHPKIFQSLLANKLKFKDLKTQYWDKNKNKKYHCFDLIDTKFFNHYSIESIPLKQNVKSHNNQYNKFRNMVHMYLDNEHSIYGVMSFLRCNIWNKPVSRKKYHLELHKAINSHDQINTKDKTKKVKILNDLLNCDGQIVEVMRIKISLWLF